MNTNGRHPVLIFRKNGPTAHAESDWRNPPKTSESTPPQPHFPEHVGESEKSGREKRQKQHPSPCERTSSARHPENAGHHEENPQPHDDGRTFSQKHESPKRPENGVGIGDGARGGHADPLDRAVQEQQGQRGRGEPRRQKGEPVDRGRYFGEIHRHQAEREEKQLHEEDDQTPRVRRTAVQPPPGHDAREGEEKSRAQGNQFERHSHSGPAGRIDLSGTGRKSIKRPLDSRCSRVFRRPGPDACSPPCDPSRRPASRASGKRGAG